jgi:hypothetical protein
LADDFVAEDGWWVGVSPAADGMQVASANRASEYFYEDLTGSGISQGDGWELPRFIDTLEEGRCGGQRVRSGAVERVRARHHEGEKNRLSQES